MDIEKLFASALTVLHGVRELTYRMRADLVQEVPSILKIDGKLTYDGLKLYDIEIRHYELIIHYLDATRLGTIAPKAMMRFPVNELLKKCIPYYID